MRKATREKESISNELGNFIKKNKIPREIVFCSEIVWAYVDSSESKIDFMNDNLKKLIDKKDPKQKNLGALRRTTIVSKLWRAAEKQVSEIEDRFSREQNAFSENDAKMLSVIAKAVRDLVLLDQELKKERVCKTKEKIETGEERSYEGFRREIEEKLEQLAQERGYSDVDQEAVS